MQCQHPRMTGSLLLDILLFLYAVVAPGVALAWLALRDRDPVVLGSVGITVGVFLLALLHFVVAMVLRTHISVVLLLADATVILLMVAAVTRLSKRNGA